MSDETKQVRLRVTMVFEYDADPANYGTDDPRRMAEIDQSNFISNKSDICDLFNIPLDDLSVKVEPIKKYPNLPGMGSAQLRMYDA